MNLKNTKTFEYKFILNKGWSIGKLQERHNSPPVLIPGETKFTHLSTA